MKKTNLIEELKLAPVKKERKRETALRSVPLYIDEHSSVNMSGSYIDGYYLETYSFCAKFYASFKCDNTSIQAEREYAYNRLLDSVVHEVYKDVYDFINKAYQIIYTSRDLDTVEAMVTLLKEFEYKHRI